ncbi:hypothetical protein NP233_g3912 [Leucocoprinus birnbaumii]|uniref:Nephrocystin 3-like N-terminal domain-containing protein n=1 Tax=Leucocoprinus birnbaumii TaxID=56174 RepID=A0AAD5VYB8_9AGAR|nr:hypothetical protein NP233_g3912 [Leucocoprinus birnbaumii]
MPLFEKAHDFQVNNSLIVDYSRLFSNELAVQTRVGLQKLLESSIPGATYDSSDRYPPPLCHPGTRGDHIEWLENWVCGAENPSNRIVWVHGPAGVGKSAIAQSCAERLAKLQKLGATFFASRPNDRNDPTRVFTTLAYQLAMRLPAYGKLLDEIISLDPTLVKKALPFQFQNLIVAPIRKVQLAKETVPELAVVIDGLDECGDAEAQQDLIRIVAKSIQENTTPLLWIFFSRLEPHILSMFDSPAIRPLVSHVTLTISRKIDEQIFLFLREKLEDSGQKHGLFEWPSDRDILILVNLSSGLFAYAHTVVLFVKNDGSQGLQDRLALVLRLADAKLAAPSGEKHPLYHLDFLYTLILERLPREKLQIAQWILLVQQLKLEHESSSNGRKDSVAYANLLGLTERQFRSVLQPLHPVMSISLENNLEFYHVSFIEFLEDPSRSHNYSFRSARSVLTLLDHLLDVLSTQIEVSRIESGQLEPRVAVTWVAPSYQSYMGYKNLVGVFFQILQYAPLVGDSHRIQMLQQFDFRKVALISSWCRWVNVECLLQNLRPLNLIRSLPMKNVVQVVREILTGEEKARFYTIGGSGRKATLLGKTYGIAGIRSIVIQSYSRRDTARLVQKLYQEKATDASMASIAPMWQGLS